MTSTVRRLPLAAVLLSALTAPAGAEAKVFDLPSVLGEKLTTLSETATVPVLIPQTLPFDFDDTLSATATPTDTGYEISLEGDPDCGGANACTLGSLTAQRAIKRTNRIRVTLIRNTNGWYRDLSCGASCAPPSIEFTRNKVLYTIQAKIFQRGKGSKEILRRAANSAIKQGPR